MLSVNFVPGSLPLTLTAVDKAMALGMMHDCSRGAVRAACAGGCSNYWRPVHRLTENEFFRKAVRRHELLWVLAMIETLLKAGLCSACRPPRLRPQPDCSMESYETSLKVLQLQPDYNVKTPRLRRPRRADRQGLAKNVSRSHPGSSAAARCPASP